VGECHPELHRRGVKFPGLHTECTGVKPFSPPASRLSFALWRRDPERRVAMLSASYFPTKRSFACMLVLSLILTAQLPAAAEVKPGDFITAENLSPAAPRRSRTAVSPSTFGQCERSHTGQLLEGSRFSSGRSSFLALGLNLHECFPAFARGAGCQSELKIEGTDQSVKFRVSFRPRTLRRRQLHRGNCMRPAQLRFCTSNRSRTARE